MNFEPFPEVEFTGGSCVCSSRRIRIAGLSRDTTEDSLKNVLQYFGDMECEIWPPSKSALVTFYDLRAAQCCLMKLRLIPSMTHVRLDGGTQPVTPTTTPVGAVGKVTLTAIPGKDQATPKLRESNYIDLNAIAEGTEKRTTVMLRNIPNKVDQKALKSFLDETNAYTYDFLYLRIDFGNKCNVGYAFISFTEPKHISRFVVARRGAKWNHYNSEKVIDVSFANYQGRENLIKKFRNSPIMDADPAYRPKLYYTSGPLLGSEEPFPPPTMDEDY